MISNKNKKVCISQKYIEHLTLFFAVTGRISISAFASLANISRGIMSSTIGLNICAIISSIKKYKSIIKKKKIKHDEVALFAKNKLDYIKGLISTSLTKSYIGHDCFLVLDVLRKYDDMKEEIDNFKA